MSLEIRIKKIAEDVILPEKIEQGDWIDLRASRDVSLHEGKNYLIPLGIAMKLPDGYEAHVAPRSSSFKKWGIIQTNSVGIIDNSYCGDEDQWMMPVLATRKCMIHKNDRICQFRLVKKQPDFTIVQVDHLSDESRGGFGSTGTN